MDWAQLARQVRQASRIFAKGMNGMGMYTGIRAKVVLKDEWVPIIQALHEKGDWNKLDLITTGNITEIYQLDQRLKLCDEWAKVGRSIFIPFGSLAYMPSSWDKDPQFEPRRIDDVGGKKIWTFQCSLKNYEDEIETFFEKYLPHMITEVIHLQTKYESSSSQYWKLEDGEIVQDTAPTSTSSDDEEDEE